MKNVLIAAIIAGAALGSSATLARGAAAQSKKSWDYKVLAPIPGTPAGFEQKVNEAARDGWEFSGYYSPTQGNQGIVLRRPAS